MIDPAREPKVSSVPFGITRSDRIPVQRYYDREFYELERDKLWTRLADGVQAGGDPESR